MTSLRSRIRYVSLTLLALVLVLGAYVLPLLHGLGEQVQLALDVNYVSIAAGLHERDVLIILQLAERDGQAQQALPAARANFGHWSDVEQHHISEDGEQQLADEIDARAHKLFDDIATNPSGSRHDGEFDQIRTRVGDMIALNEAGMFRTAARSQQVARTLAFNLAAGCGILLLVSSLLSLWLGRSLLASLGELTRLMRGVSQRGSQSRIGPQSFAELEAVACEFNLMADRLEHDGNILNLVFDTMNEGVDVYDTERKVIYQNPRARALVSTQEPIFNLETFSAEHTFYVEEDGGNRQIGIDDLPISRALRGEVVDRFNLGIGSSRDGAQQWFDVSAMPLRDHAAKVIGAVAVFSETTESKHIDTERALLASIVKFSADAIIGLTPDLHISSWNPAAEQLFGYSEQEVLGKSPNILVPPDRFDELEDIHRRLSHGEAVRTFESMRLRRSGSTFPVLLSIGPILAASGKILGYSDIVTDVSEHKREEELRAARDVAEEAARMRSQFLANMSHEIRTPLNPVLGMAQLLLLTHLDQRQRQYVETIWSSGDLLRQVVDDILDFSKYASGKLSLDVCDFDVTATVESAVEVMAERADAKHLELALEIEPEVPRLLRGDANRLRQVLHNLIGNAIKFTQRGEVIVKVSVLETSAAAALLGFSVTDTGIGISEAAKKQLFTPFMQADASTSRQHGGTGLGLAICRQLVERMNGTIGVESTPGKGARFHFSARFAKAQSIAPSRDATSGMTDKRVLIVNDNASARAILSRQLAAWNIISTYAESGAGAIEAMNRAFAEAQPFHAALIDMNMPGMNGRELAHAIRANRRFAATRLALALPPSADSSDIKVPGEVDAILFKPIKRVHLIETLCALVAADNPNCVHSSGRLTLPNIPAIDTAPPVGTAQPARRAKILLVEDEHVNQLLALNQLEYLGYHAEAVASGQLAMRALDRSSYDLILMDCQMPMMDGYQTTALIRKREGQQRHTTIIAMTANAMEGDREKCVRAGMDDYISKPVDLTVLAGKLRQWLTEDPQRPAALSATASHVRIDAAVIADMREISRRCGYDVLRKTAEIFFADAPRRIAELRATVSVHDLARAAEIAHQLKGAAGCVGITSVRELCAEIEANSKRGMANNSEELIRDIETEVSGARAVLLPEEEADHSAAGCERRQYGPASAS